MDDSHVPKLMAAVARTAGAAPACAQAPAVHEVAMRGFQFVPHTTTAAVGDTIMWTNEDVAPHTATDSPRQLNSGSIDARRSWRYVVRRTGTYRDVCTFHPTMTGTIEVH